jgi:hypothetical protein
MGLLVSCIGSLCINMLLYASVQSGYICKDNDCVKKLAMAHTPRYGAPRYGAFRHTTAFSSQVGATQGPCRGTVLSLSKGRGTSGHDLFAAQMAACRERPVLRVAVR